MLQVEISEQSYCYFLLTNQSQFSMDVSFELAGSSSLLQHLNVAPDSAAVGVGDCLQASLLFSPRGFCDLQDVKLTMKVRAADLTPLCFFFLLWLMSFPPSLLSSPGQARAHLHGLHQGPVLSSTPRLLLHAAQLWQMFAVSSWDGAGLRHACDRQQEQERRGVRSVLYIVD